MTKLTDPSTTHACPDTLKIAVADTPATNAAGHLEQATQTIGKPPISRLKAMLIHLAISMAIFLILFALLIGEWYPSFFFDTDGGWEGLRILIGVDLVLGPLLTLIVYRPQKPGLLFDLSLIGATQLICLIIGTHIVYSERPLALVFVDDHFVSVSQGSFDFAGTKSSELKNLPGDYPKQIYIEMPADKEERKALKRRQVSEGPLHARPALFRPFPDHAQEAVSQGISISQYRKDMPDKDSALTAWLKQTGYQEEAIIWVPYTARYRDSFLVLDRQSGKILGLVPKKFSQ